MSGRPNTVIVSLPSEGYASVVRLVAAGFLARLGLNFEEIDDLQLALDLVLRSGPFADGQAVVRMTSEGGAVTFLVSGFEAGVLDRRLTEIVRDGIELGRVLMRLVDTVDARAETLTLRRAYGATAS